MAELTEEQRRARRRVLAANAVAAATQNRWDEAERWNREILALFPDDPEASNRLGKALYELNRYPEALEAYENAVRHDPMNVIAQRNLARLRLISSADLAAKPSNKLGSAFFIEEIGKTGMAVLNHVASPEVVAQVSAGDEVQIVPDDSVLKVTALDGSYLGRVEGPLGKRLMRLIEGGNQYQAGVVMAEARTVRILIRETYRAPEQAGRISFPPRTGAGVRPYTRDSLLRRGEEDDIETEDDLTDLDEADEDEENPSEFGFSETTLTEGM